MVAISTATAAYIITTSKPIAKKGITQIPCDHTNTPIPRDAKAVAPNSEYMKNDKHVYLLRVDEARIVPNADPATFRVLPTIDEFGIDAHHVYYAGCELPDANVTTFKYLPDGTYGIDGSHVYWRWIMLPGADATKFVSLPRGYGKDGVVVYWEGELVPGADPATFQSFADKTSCNGSCTITAQDKNHSYMLHDVVQ